MRTVRLRNATGPRRKRPGPTTLLVIGAVVLLTAPACKRDSGDNGTDLPASAPAPATLAPSPEDEAIATWKTMLAGLTREPAAVDAAKAISEPGAFDTLHNYVEKPTKTTSNARALVNPDGTVTMQDCVRLDPPFNPLDSSIGFKAFARRSVEGWKIFDVFPFGRRLSDNAIKTACISKATHDAAISGYREYWSATEKFWDPADPDSPLVAEVTTGQTLANQRRLLRENRGRNSMFRGSPQLHPEVTHFTSPTELVILDCQLQDPNFGFYDRTTGTRLPDAEPIKPGQRDAAEVTMRLEEGRWKIAKFSYAAAAPCEYAPTDRGITVW